MAGGQSGKYEAYKDRLKSRGKSTRHLSLRVMQTNRIMNSKLVCVRARVCLCVCFGSDGALINLVLKNLLLWPLLPHTDEFLRKRLSI